jgi:hypothetical protein
MLHKYIARYCARCGQASYLYRSDRRTVLVHDDYLGHLHFVPSDPHIPEMLECCPEFVTFTDWRGKPKIVRPGTGRHSWLRHARWARRQCEQVWHWSGSHFGRHDKLKLVAAGITVLAACTLCIGAVTTHSLISLPLVTLVVVLAPPISGTAVWAARKYVTARRCQNDRGTQWSVAKVQLSTILGQYGEYETDLLKAWECPIVGDISQPETARFMEALSLARQADRAHVPRQDATVQQFTVAVADAARCWESLEGIALHCGTRRIPPGYAAAVNRAIALLRHGLDGASSELERHQFVQRAIQEARAAIDRGYLRVPRQAMETLGAATAPALTGAQ